MWSVLPEPCMFLFFLHFFLSFFNYFLLSSFLPSLLPSCKEQSVVIICYLLQSSCASHIDWLVEGNWPKLSLNRFLDSGVLLCVDYWAGRASEGSCRWTILLYFLPFYSSLFFAFFFHFLVEEQNIWDCAWLTKTRLMSVEHYNMHSLIWQMQVPKTKALVEGSNAIWDRWPAFWQMRLCYNLSSGM